MSTWDTSGSSLINVSWLMLILLIHQDFTCQKKWGVPINIDTLIMVGVFLWIPLLNWSYLEAFPVWKRTNTLSGHQDLDSVRAIMSLSKFRCKLSLTVLAAKRGELVWGLDGLGDLLGSSDVQRICKLFRKWGTPRLRRVSSFFHILST